MPRKKVKLALISFTFIFFVLYLTIESWFSGLSPARGWEGNVSRNASYYVNETITPRILPERFCVDKRLLLVIVCSRPDGFAARQAIRETWAQTDNNVSVFFLLGEVGNNYDLQMVEVEGRLYQDVIQEHFMDTYNNLTVKSINMLKLFNIYCTKHYLFLMKVDDDVFLNLPLIVPELQRQTGQQRLLMGRIKKSTAPIRIPWSKWYMPYDWYPYAKYPDFLCGPVYVMSAQVARELYNCALHQPLLHFEDVFITGVCAKLKNITLVNSNSFKCNANKLTHSVCHYRKNYNFHYVTPENMYYVHRKLQSECRYIDKDVTFSKRASMYTSLNF